MECILVKIEAFNMKRSDGVCEVACFYLYAAVVCI